MLEFPSWVAEAQTFGLSSATFPRPGSWMGCGAARIQTGALRNASVAGSSFTRHTTTSAPETRILKIYVYTLYENIIKTIDLMKSYNVFKKLKLLVRVRIPSIKLIIQKEDFEA